MSMGLVQQLAVSQRTPVVEDRTLHRRSAKGLLQSQSQARGDSDVEQNLHAPAVLCSSAVVSTFRSENRAPAARKTASAARRSIRNSSTNSSRGTPSASQSKSCCTGSRLPRKHGAPLMRSGSTQTASSRVTTSFIGIMPLGVLGTSILIQSVAGYANGEMMAEGQIRTALRQRAAPRVASVD